MSIITTANLIQLLYQHRLLGREQIRALVALARSQNMNPRTLARALVQRDWLTVYQVNQVLAGHAATLGLGPYRILDRLGQGGQSQVFKARHTEYGWLTALKVIRSELLESLPARQQFLQEMEAMAQLDHPNVIQFFDADQCGDTFYCAMEYVEGTDLGKLVRLAGPQTPAAAAEYVRQAAVGLQHAHERNLIHRDIKPVNLILTHPSQEPAGGQATEPPAPLVKILDWGLASLRPPSHKAGPGGAGGAIIGTADYLSPEQAKNADAADIRSDIYSLGCTLYYLLTGQPPFPGNSLAMKVIQHQTAAPAPVEPFNPEVTTAFAAIVGRMMAKRPEDRYQTPAAVALALKPFCRKPAGASATPARSSLPPRPPQPCDATRVAEDTPVPTVLPAAGRLPTAARPPQGRPPAPQQRESRLTQGRDE